MPLIRDKYDIVKKAEQDRIVGSSFIPSYGKFPVHNERYNKLVQYLEKLNKNLQVENPTQNQKNIQEIIEEQINLSRLKILNDQYLNEKKDGSFLTNLKFRDWCGKGTPLYNNIKNDLDDPNKMYDIDKICLMHDVSYTKSKTYEEQQAADFKMIKDIFSKYVLNLNRNFIIGDYESDFTNLSASSKTVINYLLSLVESYYTYIILKDIPKSIYEFLKLPYQYITNYLDIKKKEDYFKDIMPDIENNKEAKKIYNNFVQIPNLLQSPLLNTIKMKGKELVSDLTLKYLGTSLIQDKIYALSAMSGILLKNVIEAYVQQIIPSYKMVDFNTHNVSEEDLKNLIEVFETLQNDYLKDSNMEAIKIGDEWLNEKIEYPSPEKLNEDIIDTIKLNQTYISTISEIDKLEINDKKDNLNVYDEIYDLLDEFEKEEKANNLKIYDEIYDILDEFEKEERDEQKIEAENIAPDVIRREGINMPEEEEENETTKNENIEPIEKNNKDEL